MELNLTKDMDAALDRMLKFYDEEGIEYSFGEPGTGRLLVTDGDEILGELKPVDVEEYLGHKGSAVDG
ncbi:hypothetical protein [Exiguobacterium sp. s133]|uniref:hypothetical protein n=1 Tax=Exiguobacterium sp. s133 TaxID=2751213 RepID=UPI001BE51D37|nr:hypothetical protein [Exiguobacterium sp. s133]